MKPQAKDTKPLSFRVPVEFKDRLYRAAAVRDGDNISRLVRRAVDELIEREQLLESTTATPEKVA